MAHPARPTVIRYFVLGLTTAVAVLLYVDRYCVGFVAPYIRENLGLSNSQIAFVIDAFFYTYALGQIPCGWLSDRFGARMMLALYLAIWSSLTGLMGLAQGMAILVAFRFACGLFEAGAYPSCAGLIRRWIPYPRRGLASGIVSLGGRIGGTVVPMLTAYLTVTFVPAATSSMFVPTDILDARGLAPLGPQQLARPTGPTLTDIVAPRVRAGLSSEARQIVDDIAARVTAQLQEQTTGANSADPHELYRNLLARDVETLPPEQAAVLVEALNRLLHWPELLSHDELLRYGQRVQSEAVRLSAGDRTLSADELARHNRLVLEAAFPEALRKIYGDGWRPVLLIYGGFGVLLAGVFWLLVRDGPAQHPFANEAEVHLIGQSEPATVAAMTNVPAGALWRGMLTSRSLWLSAFVQFGTNFSWVFLPNLFPLYLQQVHQMPELERGWMASLPFAVSLPMLLVGGWWTDRMTRSLGARWGRALPLVSTRLVAAVGLLSCIWLQEPWPITIALCFFALVNDMGLPAVWAYCLDVGGRNVGVVLGWGNMWGNLGAAVSTSTLVFIQSRIQGQTGWQAVFATCAAVLILIGVASLGIDATQPIVRPPEKAVDAEKDSKTDGADPE
jgi:MFS transporter, ACS family, glucarate transporter